MAESKLHRRDPALPRYIVVEGPIGVGKTSLARRLAESFGYDPLLEGPEENPFLDRFYREGRRNALPTQLSFLLQRQEQLRALRQQDLFASGRVADFMPEKDALFAAANLDDDELALYRQVAAALELQAPTPDLVIYLQAPATVLMERILRRGIPAEQGIEPDYLAGLAEDYARFFHFYDAAPLLIVNASEIDLVGDPAQYDRLVEVIRGARSARSYFNPHPTLI